MADAQRDKAELKCESTYLQGYEGDHPRLRIKVANVGRRPTSLQAWVQSDAKGNAVAFSFKTGGLHRLSEHEAHSFDLDAAELFVVTPDNDFMTVTIWIEDVMGDKHLINDIDANVARLVHARLA